MQNATTGGVVPGALPAARRRVRILSSVVLLLLAAATLIVFIGVLGDIRRQSNALLQAERHAATYAGRAEGTGILPLNLEPEAQDESGAGMIPIEWLGPDEARLLRKCRERVIVARTVPVVKAMGRNGRAVVFFRNGQFDVEWVTLSEFDELHTAQRAEIQRCAQTD